MNIAVFFFFIVVKLAYICDGYKILLVAPLPGNSQSILCDGMIKHLTLAGHEITLVTPFPKQKPPPMVREIDVSENIDVTSDVRNSIQNLMDYSNVLDLYTFVSMASKLSIATLENKKVQDFLNDPSQHFDLIIAQWLYNDLYSVLSAIFECPFIWFSPAEPYSLALRAIDEFPNPAYTPDVNSINVPPFTFAQRVYELFYQFKMWALDYFYASKIDRDCYERLIVPILNSKGKPVPTYEELKFNVSLILGNSHVALGQPIRLPENYKSIGGFHIDANVKPLPKDLKGIMDNATDGVIYFSMGSNVESKNWPKEIKENLLKMFGELKQTVLWKIEEDQPNPPSNVHFLHWAPQQSILNHPKCVIFISHGGQLSTTEAIHFGVPIVGIPVFGDQFNNVDRSVKKGFAKKVGLSSNLVEDLKNAINDVLTDDRYARRVKELSFIYHHRPTSPGAELVHWVEHVIRTGGALHLRSNALHMPWFQKLYLDALAVLTIGLLLVFSLLKYLKTVFITIKRTERKKKQN